MARARNIKPGFFANEDLAELPFSTRLLFIGLWTLADREGRLEDRPKRIKMAIFPADNVEVSDGLDELARFGFIERYESGGVRVIAITAWHKHQAPHHTEKASELPDKNGELTVKAPLDHGDKTVSSRKQDGGNPPDSLIPDSLIPEEDKEQPVRAKRSPPPECPDDVEPQVWADWLALRKAKKAPASETVISQARSEAVKAGLTLAEFLRVWCIRGSQGLMAEWLKPDERGRSPPTAREQRQAETVRAWMGSALRPQTDEEPHGTTFALR